MLSPRRSAQLGLSAASLTLVTSIAILIAGSSDPAKAPADVNSVSSSAQVAPLASGTIVPSQPDQAQHFALAK
jgi:hypothetical protein